MKKKKIFLFTVYFLNYQFLNKVWGIYYESTTQKKHLANKIIFYTIISINFYFKQTKKIKL